MSGLWLGLAVTLAIYAAVVIALLVAGRREHARALAGFVPDCAVLLARVAREPGFPRVRAWALLALVAYLASPIDLIPDFIPGLGYLDDAVLVALALRWTLRVVEREELERKWPGPRSSLDAVLRLAGSPG